MVRKLAIVAVLAAAGLAQANGRPPGTSTINFRQGHEQDVLAGMTFGNVISHDGGATWHWMCEKAVLYGGLFDPDYAYAPSGAVFATTFDGSLVMRDGCSFQPTSFAKKFFSSITLGPDGALFMAAADPSDTMGNPGDAKIYKSTNDGMAFPTAATVGQVGDWYNSIEVSPQDPTHVYISAYRIDQQGGRTFQMYKSTNGGTSFTAIPTTDFVTSGSSVIDIVGIRGGSGNDTLFARVSVVNGSIGDAIYRSINSGQTWTKIFEKNDEIAFVLRSNNDLVAGTRTMGMFVAHGISSTTFTAVANAPHVNCLVENAAHELWACTQNYAVMQQPSDDAGIMKTTDLATWTKVLRYQDIAGPVDCAAGTRQHDQCVYDCPDATYDDNPATCPNTAPTAWCALRQQLGITANNPMCAAAGDSVIPGDGSGSGKKDDPGCCQTGDTGGGPAALAISALVGTVLLRTRRRKGS